MPRFLDIPTSCPGCEESSQNGRLCDVCQSYLSRIESPCLVCGEPDAFEDVCGQCLQSAPPWDQAIIPFQFEGLTRFLIHQFKYHNDMSAGKSLIAVVNRVKPSNIDALVAVPMHHARRAQKGFNQADKIASYLSRQWEIPVQNCVKRVVATPALEGLNKTERKRALKGAFELTRLPPKTIMLVDDVFTSGATASELTRLFKRNGTQFVAVCALARTPLSS